MTTHATDVVHSFKRSKVNKATRVTRAKRSPTHLSFNKLPVILNLPQWTGAWDTFIDQVRPNFMNFKPYSKELILMSTS